MLYKAKPSKIHLYQRPVDFRKQINGLAAIVETEFGGSALDGRWFVFVARDKKKVKILYFRHAGLCLWQYRLDEDLFCMGRPRGDKTTCVN